MSNLSNAFDELRSAFQEETDSEPTITFGATTVSVICGEVGVDPVFVGGGVAEGASISVMYKVGEFATDPEKLETVALADHPSAPDGTYHVLEITHREAMVTLILGNSDAS